MNAVADAIAAHCPPEREVNFSWPDTILFDGGLLGGARLQGPGYFFAPTVLTDIPRGSPAHQEELFGPVASLWRVDGIEEAIRLANDTNFGLGACLWTNDDRERELFIEEIQAGLAFVNGMVASSPELPFGGIKHSGYGRELSIFGIREFVNIQTVWIGPTVSGQQTSKPSE